MKRIVIGVITYNQENVIKRALDSVLCQKEWGLYRLVISDDCSCDGTWEILKEYKRRYPDSIIINRNERNRGIYGNVSVVESLLPSDGDLYGALSGDDEYCDGYFEGVQSLIEEKQIDTDGRIGIYSDWKSISPDSPERVVSQRCVLSNYPVMSLKLRGLVTNRSFLYSRNVRDLCGSVLFNKGLAMAEGCYDIQPHYNIKNAYYLPQITSIYYSGIGVSVELKEKKSEYNTTQRIELWQHILAHFVTASRDIHYAMYELTEARFYLRPSLQKVFLMFYHFLGGRLPGLGKGVEDSLRLFMSYFKYWIQELMPKK